MSATIAKLSLLGVLTGSRAFNVATEESDYDFIIYESKIPQYMIDNPTYSTCNPDRVIENIERKYENIRVFGEDLIDITKFVDEEGNIINLFIYKDSRDIYTKFKELNNRINLLEKSIIEFRPSRIAAFVRACSDLEISYIEEIE